MSIHCRYLIANTAFVLKHRADWNSPRRLLKLNRDKIQNKHASAIFALSLLRFYNWSRCQVRETLFVSRFGPLVRPAASARKHFHSLPPLRVAAQFSHNHNSRRRRATNASRAKYCKRTCTYTKTAIRPEQWKCVSAFALDTNWISSLPIELQLNCKRCIEQTKSFWGVQLNKFAQVYPIWFYSTEDYFPFS